MAVFDAGQVPSQGAGRASVFVNYAGAAISLALIVGVSLWGYKLIMRDVSGIPVVRAMEGDMRVLPDNPGGDVARHTGLAVNEVAAEGEAGAPEDRLVLAPRNADLEQEDLEVQPMAEADEVVPAEVNQDDATHVAAAVNTANLVAPNAETAPVDDIEALADQLAAGIEPLAELDAEPKPEIIAASVPGVAVSLRPASRPASLRVPATQPVEAAPAPRAEAATQEVAVTTTEFAAGTNLVQLGAFPSPDLAATEWGRLEGKFTELMDGKERVIQVSTQTSGTWYRLRANGFENRADARRFCVALEAEGANCIAVVVK